MNGRTLKILFLCYGNSCRSILAEALARHFWGKEMEVSSAGLFPLGHVTPYTLEALREKDIPVEGLHSKGLEDVPLGEIDYIVNLTNINIQKLIPGFFSGKVIPCYVRDPYGEGLDSFRKARDELKVLVIEKLPEIIRSKSQDSGAGR